MNKLRMPQHHETMYYTLPGAARALLFLCPDDDDQSSTTDRAYLFHMTAHAIPRQNQTADFADPRPAFLLLKNSVGRIKHELVSKILAQRQLNEPR